jgi:hypothetical protein
MFLEVFRIVVQKLGPGNNGWSYTGGPARVGTTTPVLLLLQPCLLSGCLCISSAHTFSPSPVPPQHRHSARILFTPLLKAAVALKRIVNNYTSAACHESCQVNHEERQFLGKMVLHLGAESSYFLQ